MMGNKQAVEYTLEIQKQEREQEQDKWVTDIKFTYLDGTTDEIIAVKSVGHEEASERMNKTFFIYRKTSGDIVLIRREFVKKIEANDYKLKSV